MYIPANAIPSADCPTWDEAAHAASFLHRFARENANRTWHIWIHQHTNEYNRVVWGVWHTEQPATTFPRQNKARTQVNT